MPQFTPKVLVLCALCGAILKGVSLIAHQPVDRVESFSPAVQPQPTSVAEYLVGVSLFGGTELRQIPDLTVAECKAACDFHVLCGGMSLAHGPSTSVSPFGVDPTATGYCWLKQNTGGWKEVAEYGTVSWNGRPPRVHVEAAAPPDARIVVAIPSFPRRSDGPTVNQHTRLSARMLEARRFAARSRATVSFVVAAAHGVPINCDNCTVIRVATGATGSAAHHKQQGDHFVRLLAEATNRMPNYIMWLEDDAELQSTAFLPTATVPTVWSLAHRSGYDFNGVNSCAFLFPLFTYNMMADCLGREKVGPDWRVHHCCGGIRCVGHGPYVWHQPGASTNVWRNV